MNTRRRRGKAPEVDGEAAAPDEVAAAEEEVADEDGEQPMTLDSFEPPKRGIVDRMLRPSRVVSEPWSGVPRWKCTKCRFSTFDEKEANQHRC